MSFIKEPKTVSIIGAPLALGQDLEGVELAPNAMRRAGLKEVIEELGWQVDDNGDLPVEMPGSRAAEAGKIEEGKVKYAREVGVSCHLIEKRVQELAQQGRFCLTLGGDHSIALGSINGVVKARPETALVWVDAHGDFNTPETSPSGHLHGMPLAALLGYFKPGALPGFEWLESGLTPDRVALIGIRSIDPGERMLIRDSGIKVFTMMEVDRYGIGRVMEMALAAINPRGNRPMHLSLDIDALDPYIAPSTGTKARGGLTYREAHFIAEALAETIMLGSMDLVEINPKMGYLEGTPQGWTEPGEKNDITVELGVELVASALGKRIL